MNKNVVLIHPPLYVGGFQLRYPATSVLAAGLQESGFKPMQHDLNNAFMDWFLRSPHLAKGMRDVERLVDFLESKRKLGAAQYKSYINCKGLLRDRRLIPHEFNDENCGAIYRFIPFPRDPRTDADLISMPGSRQEEFELIRKFYRSYFSRHNRRRPLFVGITVAMFSQLVPALILAKWLKSRHWPGIPIYIGGPAATLLMDRTLKTIFSLKTIDGVVQGEGEEAIVGLARESLKARPDFSAIPNFCYPFKFRIARSEVSPKCDINEYPVPLYEGKLLDRSIRTPLTVIVARGCPWGRCAFCEYPLLYGRKQQRDPDVVVRDIRGAGLQAER